MNTLRSIAISIAALVTVPVVADETVTFGVGDDAFEIEFVTIGSPGNQDDTRSTIFDPNPLNIGGVDYTFEIGKFEITCEDINKAGRQGAFDIGADDFCSFRPGRSSPGALVIEDARRVVNWLNTSSGFSPAYKDPGRTSIADWEPGEAGYNPDNPTRNPRARYYLPNADEFHKAAFYDPVSATYLDYSTGSNVPTVVESGTEPNTIVANRILPSGTYADVKDAGGLSAFGTMAQIGNVSEWEEDAQWYNAGVRDVGFSFADSRPPELITGGQGFRIVAITPVPEPSSLTLLAFALCSLGVFRRRR